MPLLPSSPGLVSSPQCAKRPEAFWIAFFRACARVPHPFSRLRSFSQLFYLVHLSLLLSSETQKLVKMHAKEGFRQVSYYTKRGIRSAATGFTIASTIVRKFDVAGRQKRKKAMDEREVTRRKLLMAKKGDDLYVYACRHVCMHSDIYAFLHSCMSPMHACVVLRLTLCQL